MLEYVILKILSFVNLEFARPGDSAAEYTGDGKPGRGRGVRTTKRENRVGRYNVRRPGHQARTHNRNSPSRAGLSGGRWRP